MGTRLTDADFPVQLRSFYGGQDRGPCIAVSDGELTYAQVETLINTLQEWARQRKVEHIAALYESIRKAHQPDPDILAMVEEASRQVFEETYGKKDATP